jgi:hypothetical protein
MTNAEIADEFAKAVKTYGTIAQKLFFDTYTYPILLVILSRLDESLPDAERREILLERVENEIERRVQSNDPDGIATLWDITNLPPDGQELPSLALMIDREFTEA